MRHAKVEDHDDLLPIVAAAAAGSCPSLAALPESCKPDEPFALTRLIGSQDEQNIVLVAEDQGKMVGGSAAAAESLLGCRDGPCYSLATVAEGMGMRHPPSHTHGVGASL